jgi:hypothetical protein
MANIRVICTDDHPTIAFAVEELQRCLAAAGVEVEACCPCCVGEGEGLRVGLMSSLGVQAPSVPDAEMDDAIDISVKGGNGYIAGINYRSVLAAVYRYLTELGCRWVRPGKDGEYIPKLDSPRDVAVRETESYRHRGVCIEGSCGIDHVKDMVDWMPKVGFNGYFTQFREAHTFWSRWHAKHDNPESKEEISLEDAREYMRQAVAEIKKRDLLYHGVGHGWTCEAFGISGMGWEQEKGDPSEEITQYFAEVNGKRGLWGLVGINTNICFGKDEARRLVIEEIANYSEKHPDIDIIHFWLADGSNNHCECELCTVKTPSDWYVQTLNELDDVLTARGLKTKIVFLIYVDLMWPAQTEKIKNQDRFILMFAPITRTYSSSFAAKAELPQIPPFKLNKLEFPSSVEANIAFLKGWQKDFTGDSFDFDYHLLCDHYRDPAHIRISEMLSKDVKALKDIGINGYVSCQVQRVFFPTALPMLAMGLTLWNRDTDFAAMVSDYCKSAYGPDGALVEAYLTKLSDLFDPPYMRGEKGWVSEEAAKNLVEIGKVIADFRPVIERNLGIDNKCWAKSWEYLKLHATFCELLAKAYEAVAKDDHEVSAAEWKKALAFTTENHDALQAVFDPFLFPGVMRGPCVATN